MKTVIEPVKSTGSTNPNTITITLSGPFPTIAPMTLIVLPGRFPVTWQLVDNSKRFDFADPPITFDDPNAPFMPETGAPIGSSVTYTDNNQNNSGAPVDYTYQVNLVGPNGPITWKPQGSLQGSPATNKPAIRNKPV